MPSSSAAGRPLPQISGTTVGEIRVVPSMHERKAIMFDESDAFIAIPGGEQFRILGVVEHASSPGVQTALAHCAAWRAS